MMKGKPIHKIIFTALKKSGINNFHFYDFRHVCYNAGVAQLVEQLICNQPVGGSRPLASLFLEKHWADTQVVNGGRL